MNKHYNVHTLLSLMLFLLFVIGSFFVVTYEMRGYQNIDEKCLLQDDLNIPLAYFNTKLKSYDQKDAVSIVTIDQQQCLKMTSQEATTYIYYQDGYIKELYTSNDYLPSLEEGSPLFALDDFHMQYENHLYQFMVEKDHQQKSLVLYLHV